MVLPSSLQITLTNLINYFKSYLKESHSTFLLILNTVDNLKSNWLKGKRNRNGEHWATICRKLQQMKYGSIQKRTFLHVQLVI